MAGDWIKMRTNLDTDPAVVRISSGLKTDRYSVVGRLHKIWSWANEHLTDGQDVPIDAEFLDSLVETPGFSAALRSVGWLTGRDGNLCFPSFERHNGASAKARAQDAARKKCVRKPSGKCPESVRVETGQKPDQRREEKRREDIEKEKKRSKHFLDSEFETLFEEFCQSSRVNHNWPISEITIETWLYEMESMSTDDAKAALVFSKSCGSKKPILNGDHKRSRTKQPTEGVAW